ncbi:MAG: thioesterase family protein [Pseudomonadota bacterium]
MRDLTPSCPDRDFGDGVAIMSRQTVQPDWIDYNGHMNVAFYTLAFDKAFDEFLEDWIGTGVTFVERSRFGPMALQSQVCFLGELLEGEAFHVRFWLVDHDDKRMHVFCQMIAEKDGSVAATYESLGMNVDLEARRGAPYPGWAVERMDRLMSAQKDHERPKQLGQVIGIRRKA